jgi:hypothetical protein
MNKTILATTVMTISALFAGTAKADHFEHLDGVAIDLRNQASRAAWEVRNNFRGTPEYQHLYRDVYEMYSTANHIHELIDRGVDIDHLRADVRTLDRLFHHVEDVVRNIRPAGDFDFHGRGFRGHLHGAMGPSRNDLRRLRGLLAEMEDSLHHLNDDLRAFDAPAPVAPIVRPVPHEVRIGGGRFAISVRIP